MRRLLAPAAALLLLAPWSALAQPASPSTPEVIRLWPGQAPGTESWTGTETTQHLSFPDGTSADLLTNTIVPALTVIRPAAGRANGTAVVVAPGGGFQVLAWNEEGLKVAHWLADRGVTAFVLKYRVRTRPEGQPRPGGDFDANELKLRPVEQFAFADGNQAIRTVRAQAQRFGIDPHRVGMIGFSAGAMTTMGVVLEGDPAARPDFAAPIYGAMHAVPVPADAPPLFIAAAADDNLVPPAKSVAIFTNWRAAGRPAELHIFEKGNHGFSMRVQHLPVDGWPTLFEAWLRDHGWLSPRP
jgi:acetyl esterase/lipase